MPRGRKKKTEEPEKVDPLEGLKSQLNKLLTNAEIQTLSGGVTKDVEVIPTGSIGLDIDGLGIGGIPRGRVTEIYGPEAGGKTTLCLGLIANALKKPNAVAAFIDAEHALSPEYAVALGVDLNRMLFMQPDSGEDALEAVDKMCTTGKIDLIVIDSVAALVPRAELEGDIDSQQPGMQARMMSKALRMLTATIAKSKTAVVFINQLRSKIGAYGNGEVTSGGNSLKFYASVRIDIRRIGSLKRGSEVYGNRVKVKIVKNKLAPPFKVVEFDLVFGEGISWQAELIDYGIASGAILKSGSWYSYALVKEGEEPIRIGQGRDAVASFLSESPEKTEKVKEVVSKYLCKK